jgi:hypothetical protein
MWRWLGGQHGDDEHVSQTFTAITTITPTKIIKVIGTITASRHNHQKNHHLRMRTVV